MPAVASVPKELYLSSSLKDLNKKTEVKPEKISTKRYLSFTTLIEFYVNFQYIFLQSKSDELFFLFVF